MSQIFSLELVVLTEYLASVVIVVSCNPDIVLSLRSGMSFLLLSVCLDELFFLSGSTFLVHYKVLNKQAAT